MRYFRRHWDEPRGDEHSHWGTSGWYFEVGEDGYPVRQVEIYANGRILRYDEHNVEDEFGGLGEQALDLGEFGVLEIEAAQFESAWRRGDTPAP